MENKYKLGVNQITIQAIVESATTSVKKITDHKNLLNIKNIKLFTNNIWVDPTANS